MFPHPIEKSSTATQITYKVLLPVALFVWLLPLIAVMVTSIRSAGDINAGNFWGWPREFNLIENYTAVFNNSPMGTFILNSVKVTIPTIILTLALSCMAGYALAIYRFRLNMTLFFIFIAGNFVPFQILMVPVRELSVNTGLYDTVTGLVLFHAAFQAGFCTLFMRNFIRALPFELIESARIEGVGEFRIFWNLVLPLVRPAIAALAVLEFTFIWNDYFWATVLVNGQHAMPITAGLKSLNGQWIAQWQLISAGSIMAALPPVAMFFLMQKHFIAGLTLGSTKG
ncbi:MAG: carbohydrate ABC transporter permease [Hyphomicrobiales bacterium]|nr:carbohydrate ABC transporter permease [Hyphomicrobiales bacterium]